MNINEPEGLTEVWEDNCKIEAFYEDFDGERNVTISANREGLISLAKLMLYVAREEHEDFYHVHIDEYSGIESSSNIGLIFQKKRIQGA